MEVTFMNMENKKTNEAHEFVFNFSQKLTLKNPTNMLLLRDDLSFTRGKI